MRHPSTFGFLGSAFLILSLTAPLPAQTTFQRTYGGVESDYGYSVAQTVDGGYVITGYTWSFGAGWSDAYLVKTDSLGDTMWTRTYGGMDYDVGYSVTQTTDGGYIIAGHTASYGAGHVDVYLVKTDADGDTLWTRTYGGTGYDNGYSVALTADGGYVITGRTRSFGAGNYDVWLVKTDASGDAMWTHTYGGEDEDEGWSVAQTTDGGYIIAGWTESFGAGSADIWLIRTDADGDTMWTRLFGGTSRDEGYSVAQTADGGYIVAGRTYSFGAGGYDFWLIKTDSAGNAAAIAEPEPPVAREHVKATIVRGVLFLPEASGVKRSASCVMLDISGRKAMDLHPGENDVRHLSPGVYFVREKGPRGQGFEGSSRKVILTH